MAIKQVYQGSQRILGCLLVMGIILSGSIPVGFAQEEVPESSAELTESLTNEELSELIQTFNPLEVDKIYRLEALETSFNDLLQEENLAALMRKDVQVLMGQPSLSQAIEGKIMDTYQGQATHHAVEMHFVFNNDEMLTMIQRDDHHKGVYQPLGLKESMVKSWESDNELSVADLIETLGPPVTTWYYVTRGEVVYLWQSLVEAEQSSLIVMADSVGKLKFTYSAK